MRAGKGQRERGPFSFLIQPAETGGRRQANHETWCRNADLFQNDSTVSHGGAPGPCQHRVQKPKRAGAGGRGKGRRDEVLRSRLNFRSQSYPRVPRPYSQDRDSAPSPAATPIQRHGGGPCMAAAAHEGEGRRASIGRGQSNTSKKKKKRKKRCTYWLTAASRL